MKYFLVVATFFLNSCMEKMEALRHLGDKPRFSETKVPTTEEQDIQNHKCAFSDKINKVPQEIKEPGEYRHSQKYDVFRVEGNKIHKMSKYQKSNSLWTPGNKSFFEDQRAAKVGDILTVIIDVKDQEAKLTASNTIASSNPSSLLNIRKILKSMIKESHVADAILGNPYQKTKKVTSTDPTTGATSESTVEESDEEKAGGIPNAADLAKVSGNLVSRGGDTLKFNMAAMIKSVLRNGNLYIEGNQEIIVDYEKRQITISGIIRPEDITSENTIAYDKIAEARISFGGEGAMSRQQKPRYGTELLDILSPF